MPAASKRIPVLVSPAEKSRIAAKAKRAGLSVAEYMRRAAAAYRPVEDEKALEALLERVSAATERAERAIDEALDFVAASNRRIARLEARHRKGAGA